MFPEYEKCELCPRKCGINRYTNTGFCGANGNLCLSYYSLHMWEEPIISGINGSGTIFIFRYRSILIHNTYNNIISILRI